MRYITVTLLSEGNCNIDIMLLLIDVCQDDILISLASRKHLVIPTALLSTREKSRALLSPLI